MSVTAQLNGVLTLTDSSTGVIQLQKVVALTYTGTEASFGSQVLVGTTPISVALPVSPTEFLYFRNLSTTATVTMTWTPQGVGLADQHLSSAAAFAVLGDTSITNTGATVITGGNLGLFPGTSVTGFPPGVLTVPAVQHVNDVVANQAEVDALNAYNYFAALTPATPIVGNLAGQTFTPGVYNSATTIDLSAAGTVTLDAQNDPNATFVFQAGTTLTIGNGATVSLINGATARNVVWQVGTTASIGTTATMKGTVIANGNLSIASGTFSGRAISVTGSVTLATSTITIPAGGPSNVILTVQPLGYEIFSDPNAISGITALSLVASATGTPVEFVLVG